MASKSWLVGLLLSALLAPLPARAAPDAGAGGVAGSPAAVSGGTATGAGGTAGAGQTSDTGGTPQGGTGGELAGSAGTKPDTVVVKPAEAEPPHLLESIRASSGLFRGAIAGGAITLELNRALPPEASIEATLTLVPPKSAAAGLPPGTPSRAKSEAKPVIAQIQGFPGDDIIIGVPPETKSGLYSLQLSIVGKEGENKAATSNVIVPRPQYVHIHDKWFLVGIGTIPVAVMAALVFVVFGYRFHRSKSRGVTLKPLASLLLLDPQTETYSLSRAQFIVWMMALGWAYVFLFAAQGLVQNIWTFPSLEGFGATFLVSLGTLIAAQATSSVKGSKGAGEVHPSLADLFVHGGVMALERVQQVLWTIISVGMFLYVVYKNYAETTLLPVIPNELLILMGISSVGYIGGKLARKAGPVIHRALPVAPQGSSPPSPASTPSRPSGAPPAPTAALPSASLVSLGIKVSGATFSRDATVSIDDGPPTSVVVLAPASGEFATDVQVPWSVAATSLADAVELWYAAPRRIVLVNADSQRAEWAAPPSIAIRSVERTGSLVKLTVEGHHLTDQATWAAATGGTGTSSQRIAGRPCFWLIELTLAQGETSGTLSVDPGNGAPLTTSFVAT